jgi:WD40 repeat protein
MRNVIALVIMLVLLMGAAMAPGDLVTTIDAHAAAVNAVAATPAGDALFTAGQDGRLKVWDTSSFAMLMDVPACQTAINDIAVSADGMYVVTAGEDGYVKVWDAMTTGLMIAIPAHDSAANCVAITSDSLYIYTGGDDGYVRAWSVGDDYAMVLEAHTNFHGVNDIVINSGDGYFFTAGVDGFVTAYNAITGELESRIEAYEKGEALCLAFNSLESCLVTGGTNGEIRCWDSATGALVHTIRAHAVNVNQIGFSYLTGLGVSCGADGKIKLWNFDAEMAGMMQAHVLSVNSFAMVGDALVTAGADYKVRVWEANF